jgi:hypothetical protein
MLYIRIPKPVVFDVNYPPMTTITWTGDYHISSSGQPPYQYVFRWLFVFNSTSVNITTVVIDYSKSERKSYAHSTWPMKLYQDTENNFYVRYYAPEQCLVDEISTDTYFEDSEIENISASIYKSSTVPPEGWTEYTNFNTTYIGTVEDITPIGSYVLTSNANAPPSYNNYKYLGMAFDTSPITLATGCYAWKRIAPSSEEPPS